ncbi:uncharacterized protein KIAA0040 homolog [Amblyraja radiata]|uniref:uncharacterized protein KIAA0040 homolog n=1 Tax=Amblyraja radiata TaxID=386614 RepID=UPI00140205C6|nr:uncharacterized protein KIAA0040 homolog [Amblyraja radiata]XP_032884207.1 uncharacterized protein KIAA0040 homolog [Amblyraja radiata]
MLEQVSLFVHSMWELLVSKHSEGLYNSVCLAVLLALPLLLLLLSVCLCCQGCCCSSCRRQQHDRARRKKHDDLWISSQPQPIMMESLSLSV